MWGLRAIISENSAHISPDKYKTPWGAAINYDDAWCDGVREYFVENALMWFRDFHIDALRLDAVHAIKDFSAVHILEEIRAKVEELMKVSGRVHYLIAELDLNDTKYTRPRHQGGLGMDAQWIDEFHHALRVTAGGDSNGYYSDFNGILHLAKSYKDAYVYDGQYSEHRKKKFGIKADQNSGEQFIVFSQNHDQVGNRMLGERTSKLVTFEMQKLLVTAVMVSPFLPMLFMGEEWSEPNPFLYFVSHTDPQLVEAVRKGRREEFASFNIEGEAPDPISEQTYKNSKLSWDLLQEYPHNIMFSFYKELIYLRKNNAVLKKTLRPNLAVYPDDNQNSLTLFRWFNNEYLMILMNFSGSLQVMMPETDKKQWLKILDSADPAWNGPEASTVQIDLSRNALIPIQPESVLIYSSKHV